MQGQARLKKLHLQQQNKDKQENVQRPNKPSSTVYGLTPKKGQIETIHYQYISYMHEWDVQLVLFSKKSNQPDWRYRVR